MQKKTPSKISVWAPLRYFLHIWQKSTVSLRIFRVSAVWVHKGAQFDSTCSSNKYGEVRGNLFKDIPYLILQIPRKRTVSFCIRHTVKAQRFILHIPRKRTNKSNIFSSIAFCDHLWDKLKIVCQRTTGPTTFRTQYETE
jgi:hypothetical protein